MPECVRCVRWESLKHSNCSKKRPFAALEQRSGDPTSRFNSQYRLAYSRLGRPQHGAHLHLHDCVPSTHARVKGAHWHIRRAFPSGNFRLQMQISATCTSCPRAHSRARANAELRRCPVARTYLFAASPCRYLPPITHLRRKVPAPVRHMNRHARTSRYPCTKHAQNYICKAGTHKHHEHHGTLLPVSHHRCRSARSP